MADAMTDKGGMHDSTAVLAALQAIFCPKQHRHQQLLNKASRRSPAAAEFCQGAASLHMQGLLPPVRCDNLQKVIQDYKGVEHLHNTEIFTVSDSSEYRFPL